MRKKGFELSVNFIVMLILALAVFGVGFWLATKIFMQAEQLSQDLDAQTKAELEAKLRDPSKLVSTGIYRKEIKRGGHDIFGLGVTNRADETTDDGLLFVYTASCNLAVDFDDKPMCKDNCDCTRFIPLTQSNPQTQIEIGTLKKFETKVVGIPVIVPKDAPSGVYVFNIQVYKGSYATGNEYDNVQKIYVEVP